MNRVKKTSSYNRDEFLRDSRERNGAVYGVMDV